MLRQRLTVSNQVGFGWMPIVGNLRSRVKPTLLVQAAFRGKRTKASSSRNCAQSGLNEVVTAERHSLNGSAELTTTA